MDDTKGGGTRLSTDGGPGQLLAGPGSHLDRRKYVAPPVPAETPWMPPRDWGRDTFVRPWLYYGSDIGAPRRARCSTPGRTGSARTRTRAGTPLRAGWAFGESTFRADYRAEFRTENRGWYWGWYGYASGTEASRYFGLGNETSDGGDPQSDFFKARQNQYSFTPAVTVPLLRQRHLLRGPDDQVRVQPTQDESTLLNDEQPYGYGDFGEVGGSGPARARLAGREDEPGGASTASDIRATAPTCRSGGRSSRGCGTWRRRSARSQGSAAVYLSPCSEKAPTLALRVGGEKVFGRYPYFEAAYIGGGLGGFGASAGDSPVRGLPRHRYAGDASLYGSADLRVSVSRFRFIFPGTWGVLGFGDAGRVYLDGEDSDKWHNGYGGGLWFAWLDRANVISATYARSDGDNKVYVRAGFAF